VASQLMDPTGWFSVLRYRSDPTRDEARNVAVVLVDIEGRVGGIRSAPISSISPRLRDQGLVDAVVAALEEDFGEVPRPNLERLRELSLSLQHSLYVTPPEPVLVQDIDSTLAALYRAYLAPAGGGSRTATKSAIMDRVIAALRRSGLRLQRSQYVHGFMFDIVMEDEDRSLGEVLSFATGAARWDQVENDAGHFLYGLEQVRRPGFAVIEPPPDDARESARESHARVTRWLTQAKVPVTQPDELLGAGTIQELLLI